MKHVGEFGQSTSNVGGIYGKQNQEARVIYFRVDRRRVVKDWATEFYKAGSIDLLGRHLQRGQDGAGAVGGVRQDRQDLERPTVPDLAFRQEVEAKSFNPRP